MNIDREREYYDGADKLASTCKPCAEAAYREAQPATPTNLLDTDGENRAVRSFLMAYGAGGLTVGAMRTHMTRMGWTNCWPDWVNGMDGEHLTKGGAQAWLRHLFAMEKAQPDTDAADARRLDWIAQQGDEFTSDLTAASGDGSYYVSGLRSYGTGKTFRAAIDAAMKEEKE